MVVGLNTIRQPPDLGKHMIVLYEFDVIEWLLKITQVCKALFVQFF